MQTTITVDMAFGFPGTHGNGQPYRADPYVAEGEVEFGQPVFAGTDAHGVKATGDAYIGMLVGPHQHVKWELPSEARSIKVPAGTAVGVAARGCWYTKVPDGETWAKNDLLKINANKYAKIASGTEGKVATVVEVKDGIALIRLGE